MQMKLLHYMESIISYNKRFLNCRFSKIIAMMRQRALREESRHFLHSRYIAFPFLQTKFPISLSSVFLNTKINKEVIAINKTNAIQRLQLFSTR